MAYEDYPCVNYDRCGQMIMFTEQDEEKFIKLGFTDQYGNVNKPKRCYQCRKEFKAQYNRR